MPDIEIEKYDIFISYKKKCGDKLARLIYEKLIKCGYRVFLDDKEIVDEDYVIKIEKSIEQCTDFLVLFTPGSLDLVPNERIVDGVLKDEDWVAKEIRIAQKNNCHIIPIIEEGFRAPDGLPKDIEKATHMNGVYFPYKYFDEAFTRLINVFLNCKQNYSEMDSDTETQRKAKKGDPSAINDLALKSEIGTFIIPEDKAGSFRKYLEAARKGSIAAYCNIADVFEKCSDDPHLSVEGEYYIDACYDSFGQTDEPSGTAEEETQYHKMRYLKAAKDNYRKAIELSLKKNGMKYAPALYKLGIIAEKENRPMEAFELYKEAMEQEYKPAVNAVAFYYANGIGTVLQDIGKAKELFRSISAELPHAAYNYAKLISKNSKDKEEVKRLYNFAFFHRDSVPQAAFALAELYRADNDLIAARHYYYLALDGGYYPAAKAIRELDMQYATSREAEKEAE